MLKEYLLKGVKIVSKFPMSLWETFSFCQNSADKFVKMHKKMGTFVMACVKVLAFALAVYAIKDLLAEKTSSSVETSEHLIKRGDCPKVYFLPTIIICPRPEGRRKYGVFMNETLVNELGITDNDINMLAEWKMTGEKPSLKKTKELLHWLSRKMHKPYETIEDLWIDLIDMNTRRNESPLKEIYGYHVRTTADEKFKCFNADNAGERTKTPDYGYAYKDGNHRRHIWFTPFKSRCIFVEQDSSRLAEFFRIEIPHVKRVWSWVGDLNLTQLTPEKFVYQLGPHYEKSLHIDYTVYETLNAPHPIKLICSQPNLQYDYSERYRSCSSEVDLMKNYRLFDGYTIHYVNFTPHHVALNIKMMAMRRVINTPVLSGFSRLQLLAGILDVFVGFSLFYLFQLLAKLDGMKKIAIYAKIIALLLFFGLSSLLVGIECYRVYAKWYDIKLSLMDTRTDEKYFPNVFIAMTTTYGPYNLTKANEYNVSVPLFEYIKMAAYQKPIVTWNWVSKGGFCPIKQLCPGNETCIWRGTQLLTPISCRDNGIQDLLSNLKQAYGDRYAAKDFESLMELLHKEYIMLSKKLTGKVSHGYELTEHLSINLCDLITGCFFEGKEIPNCCKAWAFQYQVFEGGIKFENNGDVIPVLKQMGTGSDGGLKILFNTDVLEEHNADVIYDGSMNKGNRLETADVARVFWVGLSLDKVRMFIDDNNFGKWFFFSRPGMVFKDALIDVGFEREFNKYKDSATHNCLPEKLTTPPGCLDRFIFMQLVLMKICGCKICNPSFLYGPFQSESIPCCSAEEQINCMTKPEVYDMNCVYRMTNSSDRAARNEFQWYHGTGWWPSANPCDFEKIRDQATPGNPFYPTKEQLIKWNQFLGMDFYNFKAKDFQCPHLCEEESITPVTTSEFFYPPKANSSSLTINIYFASLSELAFTEQISFSPFNLMAVIFSAWSIFFNESVPLIVEAILHALLKLIKRLTKKKKKVGVIPAQAQCSADMPGPSAQGNPTSSSCKKTSNRIELSSRPQQREQKPNDVSDEISIFEAGPSGSAHTDKELGNLKNDNVEIKNDGNNENVSDNAENKEVLGQKSKVCLSIFLVVSAALFCMAVVSFGGDVNKTPYVTSLNVSDTTPFQLPSVAFCGKEGIRSLEELEDFMKEGNVFCKYRKQAVPCYELFFTVVKRNKFTCLFLDNSDAYSTEESVKYDHHYYDLEILKYDENNKERGKAIYFWLGQPHEIWTTKFEPTYLWAPESSILVRYRTYARIKVDTFCTPYFRAEQPCETCSTADLISSGSYICCREEKSGTLVTKILDEVPASFCSRYTYTSSFLRTPFTDKQMNSTPTGGIKIQASSMVMISFIEEARYTLQAAFAICSTFWGMFIGLSSSQVMVTFILISIYVIKTLREQF